MGPFGGAGLPDPEPRHQPPAAAHKQPQRGFPLCGAYFWPCFSVNGSFIFVSGHLRGSPCLWMLSYQSWKIQISCSGAAAFRANCNLEASSGCLVTKLLQCHVLFFWDDMHSSIYSQICLRLMLESAAKQKDKLLAGFMWCIIRVISSYNMLLHMST